MRLEGESLKNQDQTYIKIFACLAQAGAGGCAPDDSVVYDCGDFMALLC